MCKFKSKLLEIFNILLKKENIASVFTIDNEFITNSKKTICFIQSEQQITLEKVFSAFSETINYLFLYTYLSNDDLLKEKLLKISTDIRLYKTKCILDFSVRDFALLVKTQCLALMACISSTATKDINDFVSNKTPPVNQTQHGQYIEYYRGQTDFSYKLLPSIYRNYDIKKYGNIVDKNVLRQLYQDSGLLDKYKTIFGTDDIDNNFYSYMQHACSYSPFLDLTSDYKIALSFACVKCSNIGHYLNTDSSIYRFSFAGHVKEAQPEDFENLQIRIIEEKFSEDSFFGDEPLCCMVPSNFDPDIRVISRKYTNDRMKYQKGAFLFFKSCIIVNDVILLPYKVGSIIKYKINSKSKKEIYFKIKQKYPFYDHDHLMNPYKFFDE